ncbi:hypothetical protein D3C80_1201440 [compost metagenome]
MAIRVIITIISTGRPSVKLAKSTLRSPLNIFRPIKISAGAVASFGIISAIGVNSSISKNITAAAKAVSPVFPPASAAAEDSIRAVAAGIPTIGPSAAAIESTIKGRLMCGILPCSSSRPASPPTASVVPMVEKNSEAKKTNK